MPAPVDILFATYNGAAYLPAQLDSIVEQTYPHWHLYIRDDGSSDDTIRIIEQYVGQHPEKMTYLGSKQNGDGAKGNFSLLMEASSAPYIAFCDQDDIWMPTKVALTLAALRELEDGKTDIPCLLFTDLTKIDAEEKVIAASLWKQERLNPKHITLSRLLVQNIPYGCASMVNKSLLGLATPVDQRALLHDHWLAIMAAACGKIGYLAEATILHRIHGSNASRAANPLHSYRDDTLKGMAGGRNFNTYFQILQQQAEAILDRVSEPDSKGMISPENRKVLTEFVHLREEFWLKRKYLMVRNKYFKKTWQQTIKWILRV